MLRYDEELRLRRQLTGAQLTLKLEGAGIETGLDTLVVRTVNDGCPLLVPGISG